MPRRGTYAAQVDFNFDGDAIFKVVTQNPAGSVNQPMAAANDSQAAVPFILSVFCTGAGPDFPFAGLAKTSPFKFQVVDAWAIENAAGGVGDTVKIQSGNGAASEVFTDITDAADANKADKVVTRFATIDDAATIPVGGTLKAVTASSAPVTVYAKCIRVN